MLLQNILLQSFYFIGVFFIVGFLIYLINKAFYYLIKNKTAVCYATGVIGTPIHEISHAAMCLIFFHKITEISLFRIDKESGVMGYVNHSYKKRNIYQVIGNFFIGTAPIFAGTLVILAFSKLLIPDVALEINEYLGDFAYLQSIKISFNWFKYAASVFLGILNAIFISPSHNILWFVFIILALCISIHMNLSKADIVSSLRALPFLIVFIVIFNLIFYYFLSSVYATAVYYIHFAGSYILGIMLISLILSVVVLAIAALIRTIEY